MSGGVDSSVAAALLRDAGHDVVGVTMKLWGGEQRHRLLLGQPTSTTPAGSPQHLGIDHHVFNFSDDFDAHVVEPYVDATTRRAHAEPVHRVQPPPQVRPACCERAEQLGFDAVATGHHARVVARADGRSAAAPRRRPGQGPVLRAVTCSDQAALARAAAPGRRADQGRGAGRAPRRSGLRTAAKPDSQDVCFITRRRGRAAFLGERIALPPGRRRRRRTGAAVGTVDAVELVTIGQRRGLGSGGGAVRFALDVDTAARRVTVGGAEDLLRPAVALRAIAWVDRPVAPGAAVRVQSSAHGLTVSGVFTGAGVRWHTRRVAWRRARRSRCTPTTISTSSGPGSPSEPARAAQAGGHRQAGVRGHLVGVLRRPRARLPPRPHPLTHRRRLAMPLHQDRVLVPVAPESRLRGLKTVSKAAPSATWVPSAPKLGLSAGALAGVRGLSSTR